MKLSQKLLTAFLIIIVFPCSMIAVIGSIILNRQVKAFEEGSVVASNWEVIMEPVQVLNRTTRTSFNELCTIAERSPDRFLDEKMVKNRNDLLKQKYSYLLIEKNGELIYIGNETHYESIREELQRTERTESVLYDGGVYIAGEVPFLLKQQEFAYSDGQTGAFSIVTDVSSVMRILRQTVVNAVAWGIMVIVVTAVILVVWLYMGIWRPLNALRKATHQLQEGNLDFSLEENISEDEIGQLCQDFEEMRIHLKEEIEVRIQYEQELREMISNISHDIKTPLTAIKGYAEGLLDGVADTPEKQEKYLRTIYNKANDMTLLVDELSYFTKIDTNTMPYHFEQVLVNDYFADCVEENSSELELINLHMEFYTNVLPETKVMADREQLHRVMGNLISNAVKYRGDKEEGKIVLHLWEEEQFVRVEVADTGRGIAQKDLPYIFDRFYRADASRNTKQGGTGLGLAIVKKIIEEHGGTISADSVEGQGTRIVFKLKKIAPAERKELTDGQDINH